MIRLPPRSTRTDTLFPYTTLFRSPRRGVWRLPGAAVRLGADLRVDRPLRAGDPSHRIHLRAAAERAPVPRGAVRRAARARSRLQPRPAYPEAGIHAEPRQGVETAVFLFRRPLRVLGPVRDRKSTRLN